jgi:hypothetical protein
MKERVPRKRLQRYIEINGRFDNIRPPSPVKKKRPTESIVSSKKRIPCPHGGDYGKEYNGPLVFDYKALLEFAEGDIAKVFGPEYAIIDTYPRRVRLPMEEYLLCTRVTHVRDVKLGRFNKCSTVTLFTCMVRYAITASRIPSATNSALSNGSGCWVSSIVTSR